MNQIDDAIMEKDEAMEIDSEEMGGKKGLENDEEFDYSQRTGRKRIKRKLFNYGEFSDDEDFHVR